MKQIKIRIKQCINDELEVKCIEKNISKNEYINELIIRDLQNNDTNNDLKGNAIKSQIELEHVLELVVGLHQSQLNIAKLLNYRNGEKND
ncbi:MAG: hypothetical protein ACK5NF_02300 [Bacilli bacterium]